MSNKSLTPKLQAKLLNHYINIIDSLIYSEAAIPGLTSLFIISYQEIKDLPIRDVIFILCFYYFDSSWVCYLIFLVKTNKRLNIKYDTKFCSFLLIILSPHQNYVLTWKKEKKTLEFNVKYNIKIKLIIQLLAMNNTFKVIKCFLVLDINHL